MPELSYLITKVTVPPVRPLLVPRISITSRLNARVPLILLAAGAGFGKTTLLAAWAKETHHQVAWLTLDEQDNDPIRFWTLVLLALKQSGTSAYPAPGETARTLFKEASPPPLPMVLTILLNELASREEDLALILDDYQVIDEPVIHQSLDFVLAHAPANLHLLLATRVDPPLALPRLRAHAHLVEIRDTDLRLNVHESATFLTHTMDLSLRDTEIRRVFQRTEGWLAGLQLAALFLRTHPDPSTFLTQFSGSQNVLLEYIQDEILVHVPRATRRFLLRTSILTTMCADLCQQVAQEPASQTLLETLERANLFLVPLDTQQHWYRYHPLFREALLAHLQKSGSKLVSLLHQRASTWYAHQQRHEEAIPHALAARDFTTAAELIQRFVVPQSWRNEYHTLRHWLECFPPAVIRASPDLSFLLVQAIFLTAPTEPSRLPLVEEPLLNALQGYRDVSNQAAIGSVLVAHAVLLLFQGDFSDAFIQAQAALPLLPEQERQWRGLCLNVLALQALLPGQLAQAASLLTHALTLYESTGMLPGRQFATALLGEVALGRGELDLAVQTLHRVLGVSSEHLDLTRFQLVDESGARKTHFERMACYILAHLAYERNALSEAQQFLQEALAEGHLFWIAVLTPGLLLEVRQWYAQGEHEQARALLVKLAAETSSAHVRREVHFCQAWLALKVGDLEIARQWALRWTDASAPLAAVRREEEALLRARLWIAEGQPLAALLLLEPLRQAAQAQGRNHSTLQILLLQALAHEANGERQTALSLLLQVVTRARPEGYQRLFLEEGEKLASLLRAVLPEVREQTLASFVRALLHAFVSPPEQISLSLSRGQPLC